jgi:opacity protein-like surface antigen
MKKYLMGMCLLLVTFYSYGQTKLSVGGGYDIAIPLGDLGDIAKTGHNWSLFAEYPLNKEVSLQFLAGYMIMPVDFEPIAAQGKVITFDLKSIPIKGAVKYFFYEDVFLQGEVGVSFLKVSALLTDFNANETNESTDFEAKFTFGAGIGTSFHLSEQSSINLTGKYMYVNGGDLSLDFNHILVGAGLVIHFDI